MLAATPLTDEKPLAHVARPAGGQATVLCSGPWTVLGLDHHIEQLEAELGALSREPTLRWDLNGIARLDNAGALLLWRAWGRKKPADLQCRPEHTALFAQFPLPAAPAPRRAPMFQFGDRLGAGVLATLEHLSSAVGLIGHLLLDLIMTCRHPGTLPWREISANVYRTGAQALAITALVGFLVGVTLSYLTARQLQAYGADIFVINILGVSIPRELGPLLAAIIVAGRSGSSMTAQLGVMRVTQELDALSVMGISHTLRLVLPKVLALALALPLVVFWTSAVMLLGGMVAARAELGLDPVQFALSLPAAVAPANLWLGWIKAWVFGALIALVACHFGLRIKPNTESLAAGVTSSVVTSITVVIMVDAVFAVLFSNVGL